jgi:hypothetical protein
MRPSSLKVSILLVLCVTSFACDAKREPPETVPLKAWESECPLPSSLSERMRELDATLKDYDFSYVVNSEHNNFANATIFVNHARVDLTIVESTASVVINGDSSTFEQGERPPDQIVVAADSLFRALQGYGCTDFVPIQLS